MNELKNKFKRTVWVSATLLSLFSLLPLFTACNLSGSTSTKFGDAETPAPEGKVAVRVQIDADNNGRTLRPSGASLTDVKKWVLLGTPSGGAETTVSDTLTTAGGTLYLNAGTWSFTLNGYKSTTTDASNLILSGSLSDQAISLAAPPTLTFEVDTVKEASYTGNVSLTIQLPSDHGITYAKVYKDGVEETDGTLTFADNKVVFTKDYAPGEYYISIRLYNADNELYGVIAEMVYVRSNLTSTQTYTMSIDELDRTYIITYALNDGTIDQGDPLYKDNYKWTSKTLTLPTPDKRGHNFDGWYAFADYSGAAVTEIPQGSSGDRTFYAKWTIADVPTKDTLAEALAWVADNAIQDGVYTIDVPQENETIATHTLYYAIADVPLTNVSVILTNNSGTPKTVTVNSDSTLFTVGSGVKLTLGDNITLQGTSTSAQRVVLVGGTASFTMNGGTISPGNGGGVNVSGTASFTMNGGTISNASNGGGVYMSGGTFTMSGGTISGNTASYGGGVYVDGGTFTMSGGTISGNISGYGGGVYVGSNGTFTMNGGTISGNTATTKGGGVYVGSGTFTKKSSATIKGSSVGAESNRVGTGSDPLKGNAVYVATGEKVRDSEAGSSIALDSTSAGSSGGWEYVVTFDPANGNAKVTRIVSSSGSQSFEAIGASMPSTPTYASNKFMGWYLSGTTTEFTNATEIDGHKDIVARWTAGTGVTAITLKPTAGEPSLEAEVIDVGESLTFTITGYTDASYAWYWNDVEVQTGAGASYTIPDTTAHGSYKLSVIVTTSTGEKLSAQCQVLIKEKQ